MSTFNKDPAYAAQAEIDDEFSNIVRASGATSWDTDAVYALDAAAVTDAEDRAAVNTCITKLKAASCWDGECIAFWPLLGDRTINFYDPRDLDVANRLELVGSFTESATGSTPISGAYAKTFVDLNLQARTNSLLMMVYNRTATAPTADEMLIGAGTSFNGPHIDIHSTDRIDCALAHANVAGSPVTTSGTLTSVAGMLAVSTYGPSSVSIYHNAKRITHNTTTHYFDDWSVSSPAANRQLYLWAANGNGTAQNKANREVAFAAVFLGQTKSKYVRIYNAVYKMLVDLGRNI